MRHQMHENSIAIKRPYHVVNQREEMPKKPSWIIRLLNYLGVTMPNTESPRGWSFNPATITLTLTVAGLLVGGGYYVGQKDRETQHLLERIQKAETDAAEAKKFSVYAAAGADEASGHKPNQRETKK